MYILTITLIAILVALIALFIMPYQVLALTGLSISSNQEKIDFNLHSFTKAICDENNFCQDHMIECEYDQVTKITPITGASIQFSQDWQDPRTIKQIEKMCG